MPDDAGSGYHVKELPLCRVRMERAPTRPGGDAADLNIEWMAFSQIGGIRFSPQSYRQIRVRAGKFPLGRCPCRLGNVPDIYLLHARAARPDDPCLVSALVPGLPAA